MSVININKINNEIKILSENFKSAKPFPHIQLTNFLDNDFFLKINQLDYDYKKNAEGKEFSSLVEKKKWISKNSVLPELTQSLINSLNSEEFINILKKITGIESIVATTVGNSELANYHEMQPGGYLGPHVDHGSDPKTGLPHILNVVVYLTKDWSREWRGGTSLYDSKGKKNVKELDYIPNSAVLFLHTPYSYHSVEKISEKANRVRKSIYVDYYSLSTNPYKDYNLDFKNHWFNHGTRFVMPSFMHYFKRKNFLYAKINLDYLVNKFFSK